MSTLLTYALKTSPNPLTASAKNASMTLLATNNSDKSVSIEGIFITIPVGADGGNLTNLPNQIVATPPDGWPAATSNPSAGIFKIIFAAPSNFITIPEEVVQQQSKKKPIFHHFIAFFRQIITTFFFWKKPKGQEAPTAETTAENKQSTVAVPAHGSLEFVLSKIAVNGTVGTVKLTITEGSTDEPTQVVPVSKFPTGWGEVNFNADPPNLSKAGNVKLTWNGPSGATYSIQYLDPSTQKIVNIPTEGQPPLANSGAYPGQSNSPLNISATTVFTLLVTEVISGNKYKTQAQQTVTVSKVPFSPTISKFTGIFQEDLNNKELILNWETKNAAYVEGSWTNGQESPANPSFPVKLTAPFANSYIIIAVGADGTKSKSSIVQPKWVVKPEIQVSDSLIFNSIAFTLDGKYVILDLWNAACVIDAKSRSVYKRFRNNFAVIAMSPDGQQAFSSSATMDLNTFTITRAGVSHGGLGGGSPVVFTPDGKYAVAKNSRGNLVKIDFKTLNIVDTFNLQSGNLLSMAITPDGSFAILTFQSHAVTVLNISTGHTTPNIYAEGIPLGVIITPDGNSALVVNSGKNFISVIDIIELKVIKKITVGENPVQIVITADGNSALVLNSDLEQGKGTVSVIDIKTLSVIQTTPSFSTYKTIAVSPNGTLAFVPTQANNVSILELDLPSK